MLLCLMMNTLIDRQKRMNEATTAAFAMDVIC